MIKAILVHGMGRTPLSMRLLAKRLNGRGIETHRFWYIAAFESFEGCRERLRGYIKSHCGDEEYVVIGHSLGSVLLRSAIPELQNKPRKCFFLAPPTKACRAARFMGATIFYRLFSGKMGQLLRDEKFMASLPVTNIPTTVYSGTAGPKGEWLPHKNEPNDGILSESETELAGSRRVSVNALHSFIMNVQEVASDIVLQLMK